MTTTNTSAPPVADLHASHQRNQIQNARELFELQRRCFDAAPFPSEKLRKQQLKALKSAILKHREKLNKALSADFGSRSTDESTLGDILPTIMNIDYTIRHLRQWMKADKRSVAMLFQPAKAIIMHQPLGVIGIISSWSFPVLITFISITSAIAAGNRVMLKPSETCPYTNRVFNEILTDAFSQDEVCMIEGDASVSAEFAQLPFDHLMFTGSGQVGKKVMAAAAANLTPVTLELGGKSPVFIAPDVDVAFAAKSLLFGKTINAGQSCVAPDYVLCPQEKLDALVTELKTNFNAFYPDISNGEYTWVVNDQHLARLQDMLLDAQTKGAEIIPLAPIDGTNPRRLPLHLITRVNSSMAVMQQEIFGPLLPLIGYRDIKQALQIIHSMPKPLAMYVYTFKQSLADQILRYTHAGGVCINETITHVAQADLPFGGVGGSGIGSYHAREGFLTFSHSKSVFKRGKINPAQIAYPPFGSWIQRLIYWYYLR